MLRIMKNSWFVILLFSFCFSQAQDASSTIKQKPGKGKINVQVVAGVLNSTPVGVGARNFREDINNKEKLNPQFNGGLFPKTSAYVGFNLDFQIHEMGAFGTGLTYTPKGYWNFSNEENISLKTKQFITVDYFEIPFFYKAYFRNGKMSLRFGPLINFLVISKDRTIVDLNGQKTKEKSRLGEKGGPFPKEIVPGLEAAFSFGNMSGIHGNLQFQYMGSMFKNNMDLRSIIFKLGIGYTFSK